MQLIVASLIGIPGSGKTTFSRNLLRMSQENLFKVSVLLISFDEHIKLDYLNLLGGEYKESRELLLQNIENLMQQLVENDQERWKEILSSHEVRLDQKSFSIAVGCPTLVIFDDNMFLRSMRQRIRSICKRLHCRHFQIYMKTSVDEAMKRNSERLHQVPASVIQKMSRRLEAPTHPRTVVVEENLSCDKIQTLIIDRIEDPETFAEPQEPQVQLKQSIIHDIDIITRKELSLKIRSMKHLKDLSTTSSRLNQQRKDFLESLKNRELSLSDEKSVELLRLEFIERLNWPQ